VSNCVVGLGGSWLPCSTIAEHSVEGCDHFAPGGVLIVYDKLIDDERRNEAQALLASLNMLIETAGGFDYTAAQCTGWMRDCGFADIRVEPLDGGESAVIGLKPGQ
jgi:hypothetical protein